MDRLRSGSERKVGWKQKYEVAHQRELYLQIQMAASEGKWDRAVKCMGRLRELLRHVRGEEARDAVSLLTYIMER